MKEGCSQPIDAFPRPSFIGRPSLRPTHKTTMATRSVSPGGALLRASRVFAIPPPLPKPMGDLSAKAIFNSDTATLPYPVRLSITTPPSSRAKGDWGFKRPLPLRATTKTSTPFIRVEAIDTFEHITEFGSSADHTLSLQKWQEMGVPLTVPVVKNTGGYDHGERKSVFEDGMDSTVTPDKDSPRKEDVRWNFNGPWLAGMNEGDFNAYLTREIRDKKSEFRKHLQEACAKSLTAEARRQAVGEEARPVKVRVGDVTEEQMTEYVKILRHNRTELYRLIREFLDLPPPPSVVMEEVEQFISDTLNRKHLQSEPVQLDRSAESKSPYARSGPPKTHPSAGLTYSLTNAHVFNHPEFGPQKSKSPIMARVVRPNNTGAGRFAPTLGVGGFVTDIPESEAHTFNHTPRRNSRAPSIPGLNGIEPDKEGGSKTYVEPMHAQIDPSGKVILKVRLADLDAVAIHEGTTDQARNTMQQALTRPGWRAVEGLEQAAAAGGQYAMSYGLTGRTDVGDDAARRARANDAMKDTASLLANDE